MRHASYCVLLLLLVLASASHQSKQSINRHYNDGQDQDRQDNTQSNDEIEDAITGDETASDDSKDDTNPKKVFQDHLREGDIEKKKDSSLKFVLSKLGPAKKASNLDGVDDNDDHFIGDESDDEDVDNFKDESSTNADKLEQKNENTNKSNLKEDKQDSLKDKSTSVNSTVLHNQHALSSKATAIRKTHLANGYSELKGHSEYNSGVENVPVLDKPEDIFLNTEHKYLPMESKYLNINKNIKPIHKYLPKPVNVKKLMKHYGSPRQNVFSPPFGDAQLQQLQPEDFPHDLHQNTPNFVQNPMDAVPGMQQMEMPYAFPQSDMPTPQGDDQSAFSRDGMLPMGMPPGGMGANFPMQDQSPMLGFQQGVMPMGGMPMEMPMAMPDMVMENVHHTSHHHHHHIHIHHGHCDFNPCKNGGTCTVHFNSFKCICPIGYRGEKCQVESKCQPNPCKNFGTCTEHQDDYECICHNGFRGRNCEEQSHCQPNPCKNSGTCTETRAGFVCSCRVGFKGKICQDESKCLPLNPCQNGGTCSEDRYGYKCNCREGFLGINCESRIFISPCSTNPCHNGGVCVLNENDRTKFHCECRRQYNGHLCMEQALGLCESMQPCLNGGRCINSMDFLSYQCLCSPGFEGNECHRFAGCHNCHENAECIHDRCVCIVEYEGNGKHCAPKRKSHCHPNPCENGGICRDALPEEKNHYGWTCDCPEGYHGRLCHEVDPCKVSTFLCKNGGTCENVNGSPVCHCDHPYKGTFCELEDQCHLNHNPCHHGSTCVDHGTHATCLCPTEYEGETCNKWKCADCDQHAYCINGMCRCNTGYEGDGKSCHKIIKGGKPPSHCHPNPCRNAGTCFESGNNFMCKCSSSFGGRLCEQNIGIAPPTFITPKVAPKPPKCHPNPCLNGAMCIEMGSDYECRCSSSRYFGKNCEADKCDDCDFHAICIDGRCKCRHGYKGDGYFCRKITSPQSCQCPNNSQCVADTCMCNPGYYMPAVQQGKRNCIPIPGHAASKSLTPKTAPLQPSLSHKPASLPSGTRKWTEDIMVQEYKSLGCWSDTHDWRNPYSRVLPSLEGKDLRLMDDYHKRKDPIGKCGEAASTLGIKLFAIQNGGQCFGSPYGQQSYMKYGSSFLCRGGRGGPLANNVYLIT